MMDILTEAQRVLGRQTSKGVNKYGGPLDETQPSASALIDHAIEEAADQLLYLVALRREISTTQDTPTPTDSEGA